ncbi:hypothetical protein PV379_01050 [Streptomyces caniscabiei]|uniref:hypothetical protein n=1 Tax=Streptomyces caniscabiei TaxID=2746961 RepID=UPI0029A410F6|nr:hypothetical protein [Streptomyces caniscabiei]MDX2775943.1 hypothetical protein [Streptomyces caniscabiei]
MDNTADRPDDFLARSTFLVGFLAALIGMAAFKEELATVQLSFFHWNVSLLLLAAPMIGMMLLAAYLGALAHFLSNITRISVPVSKYLSILSTAITILSLLYPVLVALVYLFSSAALSVRADPTTLQIIFIIAASVIGIGSLAASLATSNWLFSIRSIDELTRLTARIDILTNKDRPSSNKFISQYEQLTYFLEAFARVKGYGANRQGLITLAKTMHKMGIYTQQDIKKARALNELRNEFVSGKSMLDSKESTQALIEVKYLYSKVEQAVRLQQTRQK